MMISNTGWKRNFEKRSEVKRYRVFISAVQSEMATERRAVKDFILGDALLSEYFSVFLFEDAPAGSKSAEKAYLDEVKKADIYIGILGKKYGNANTNGIAPTDAEYREAKKTDKHVLIYIKGKNAEDKNREKGVQQMFNDVRHPEHGYSYKRFGDQEELIRFVNASLIEYLKEKGIVGRGGFDERICEGATLADIDQSKVEWFVKIARNARKFPVTTKAPIKEVLTHLDLIRGGKLTNAAILLFGKRPKKFFLQAEVKCVQLPDTEVHKAFPSYKIYDSNLFEQVDQAVGFVLDTTKQGVVQQAHTPQFQRPFEIPVFVIQEAIVNAVAHRNYNTTAGVQVMVFTDRVEIWNSGSLPTELTVEDLKKPHTSYPANPLIANVLYLGDYIQKVGSGILEMIKQCKAHGIPDPQFVLKRNVEFRAVLPRDILTESVLQRMALNERQMKAIEFIKIHSILTSSDYQKITKVSRQTITRDLYELVKKGILIREGKGRGARYLISRRLPHK